MSANDTQLRLVCFRVVKLFGEIDHTIPINAEKRVTAIVAPNGMGKTICLRLIDSLFARKWAFFNTVEFNSITYDFNDDSQITITKTNEAVDDDKNHNLINSKRIVVEILARKQLLALPVRWEPRVTTDGGASRLESFLPFLTRVSDERWIHDLTGANYSFSEIVENFGSQLPARIVKALYPNEPLELQQLLNSFDCHLIETQRLLVLEENEPGRFRNSARRTSSSLAISKKALSLSEIIAQNLQQYAALSQSLDSSFPQRVISSAQVIAPDLVKKNIDELEAKRELLTEAGVLDKENATPFALPPTIDNATLRVLSVYTEDTRKKLGSLQKLLDRIELFKRLVGSRFSNKLITIDRKAGIKVSSRKVDIPLDKLSSGEQHQLVLFFELLFELGENAIILIDEPELSLHVAWQAKFIEDLMAIISLNRFDVVLATHSPQLIGEYDDLVVELGDVT